MNIKDFIGIIGMLTGVIIGGLITFFITHIQLRHQEKQNRKERKIKAYEEIHKHLSTLDHQAGLHFIEIAGKVIKVDGQSTLNWSFSQLLDAMNKSKGDSLAVAIQRGGKMIDANLIAEDEKAARKNWKEILTLTEKWNVQRVKIPKSQ